MRAFSGAHVSDDRAGVRGRGGGDHGGDGLQSRGHGGAPVLAPVCCAGCLSVIPARPGLWWRGDWGPYVFSVSVLRNLPSMLRPVRAPAPRTLARSQDLASQLATSPARSAAYQPEWMCTAARAVHPGCSQRRPFSWRSAARRQQQPRPPSHIRVAILRRLSTLARGKVDLQ